MTKTVISGLLIALLLFTAVDVCLALDEAQETNPSQERPIVFKKEPVISTGAASRVALVTLLAIGMAVGGAWLIKRYLKTKGMIISGADGRLAVKETRRVSNRLTLLLVSVDEQEYLIAQAGDNTTVVQHNTPIVE